MNTNGWIKTSDKLPKTTGTYLVTIHEYENEEMRATTRVAYFRRKHTDAYSFTVTDDYGDTTYNNTCTISCVEDDTKFSTQIFAWQKFPDPLMPTIFDNI